MPTFRLLKNIVQRVETSDDLRQRQRSVSLAGVGVLLLLFLYLELIGKDATGLPVLGGCAILLTQLVLCVWEGVLLDRINALLQNRPA